MSATKVMIGGVAAAVLAAATIFGAWYFVVRSDAPPAVSLAEAVSSVSNDSRGTTALASTGSYGTWAVAADGSSFVGYRVQEQLVGIGSTTAVGRTQSVSGTFQFDGSTITGGEIVADLTTLQSDKAQRDQALQRQSLQTTTYPTATFVLTEPIDLDAGALEGGAFEATAEGKLTIHGVTREVSIELQGQVVGDRLVVVGSLPITFADYSIATPTSFNVLSIEDEGVMELQLAFARV